MEKGIERMLKVVGFSLWLGLSAWGGMELEKYDQKYNAERGKGHFYVEPMSNFKAGCVGAGIGGSAGFIFYRMIRKENEERKGKRV